MVAAAEKSALKKQLEDKAKKVAAGDAPRSEMDAIRRRSRRSRSRMSHPQALHNQRRHHREAG